MRTALKYGYYYGSGSGSAAASSAFSDIFGWWRADEISGVAGSYVLPDKSGNNHPMTQVAGTLTPGTAANGQAKITGDASGRLTSSAQLPGWPCTIVAIGRRQSGVACGFFGHTTGTPEATLWFGYETVDRLGFYNTSATLNTTADANIDSCWVGRIGYGSKVSIWNGAIQAIMTRPAIVNPAAGGVGLGTVKRGLVYAFQETLVWDRTLSLAELDEVHAYVNTRYGMSIPLWSSYTEVDSVWMGGQSNMSGRGDRGASDVNIPAEYDAALTGANIWHGTATLGIFDTWGTLNVNTNNHMPGDDTNAPTYIGSELTFAKEYVDRVGPIYIMKNSIGGSFLAYPGDFANWGPKENTLLSNNQNRRYGVSLNNWWASLRAHQIAGRRPNLKALIWYQGENDATSQAMAEAYQANATILFTELRKELGLGNTKAIIVRVHSGVTGLTYLSTLRAQQDALAVSLSNAVLVSVDSYGLRDTLHLNIAGQLALGNVLQLLI